MSRRSKKRDRRKQTSQTSIPHTPRTSVSPRMRTITAVVPRRTPTYINVERMLDTLTQRSRWVRFPRETPKKSDRVVKTLNLKLPRPNVFGRVIISRRGVSIAPSKNNARLLGAGGVVRSVRPLPPEKVHLARKKESVRRRYQEVKARLNGHSSSSS